MVCETLAIYCMACFYVVNYRYLRLIDAQAKMRWSLAQMQISLCTIADCCAFKSSDFILAPTDVVICN